MSMSPQGLTILKAFEGGPHLTPYRDPVGFWTVGWGHLLTRDRSADPGPAISLEEAERLLRQDVAVAARQVARLITVPLTQGQADALIDFAFNLGGGALQASTLRRVVNRGEMGEAPRQFRRWVYAGGVKLRGLVRRRAAEVELWEA